MSRHHSGRERAFGRGFRGLFFRAGLGFVLLLEVYAEASASVRRLAGVVQSARLFLSEAPVWLTALAGLMALDGSIVSGLSRLGALAPFILWPALFVLVLAALSLTAVNFFNRQRAQLAWAMLLVTVLFAGLGAYAFRQPDERRETAAKICPRQRQHARTVSVSLFN